MLVGARLAYRLEHEKLRGRVPVGVQRHLKQEVVDPVRLPATEAEDTFVGDPAKLARLYQETFPELREDFIALELADVGQIVVDGYGRSDCREDDDRAQGNQLPALKCFSNPGKWNGGSIVTDIRRDDRR